MSRVIYRDNTATADQESLRVAHGVQLVGDAEEGHGVNALPGARYGFTYSPGLPNAPLFAVRRYRSYEIHKLPGGDTFIVGLERTGAFHDVLATNEVAMDDDVIAALIEARYTQPIVRAGATP